MEINKLVRANIRKLKPYTSARDSYSDGLLLDANENSLGSVVVSDSVENLNRYPDPNQMVLRKKLSGYLNVKSEYLFAGVGSDEVIDLLIRIFCEPRIDSVVIFEPTYGMYKVACDINDVKVESFPLDENFQPDLSQLDEIKTVNPKLVFICSPNNPTGNLIDRELILKLADELNCIIVVDQAYIDFSDESNLIDEVKGRKNLVLLRTFSKAWGLAGVRFGFAIANPEIIDYLFKVKAPYNLNKLTTQVVLNAMDNLTRKREYVNQIVDERERLISELKMIKDIEKVFPSNANFILFKSDRSSEIFEQLVKKGIIIRDRGNQLNLKNCLRVTVGTKEENDLFLNALKEILNNE